MILDISKLDIRKIDGDGKYVDFDIPIIVKLTDVEILTLRRMHKNYNIAKNRVVIIKDINTNYVNVRNHHYNKCKIKYRIRNNFVKRIFIYGILVSLSLSLYKKYDKADNMAKQYEQYDNSIEYDDYNITNTAETVMKIEGKEENKREFYIKKYCDIYHVNYNVVYEVLNKLTNNFSNYDYLENYTINGVTCKGDKVYASCEEELLLYAIRCIKQTPSKLGIVADELYLSNDYISGVDYEKQISYFSDLFGIDKCLVYAIIRAETSFNSELFLTCNNPAGLRANDGWWKFDTKEEGIIELCLEILKYQKMGAYTVSEIGSIHAPLSDGNYEWVSNVEQIKNWAEENYVSLFCQENEIDKLRM